MSKVTYSLIEFCTVANVEESVVVEFVEHGILEPDFAQDQWVFPGELLNRCLRAERMRQELHLNLHGVALALELAERNQKLRQRIDYLEQLVDRLRH